MTATPPPPELLDDPDAIVGASGAGKSYIGRRKVEQLLADGRQVILFDPTGVWYGLQSDAAGTGRGFDVPVFGGPHGNVPVRPDQGAAVADILLAEGKSAVLDLSQFDEGDLRGFALGFLGPLRHRERVNLHLVFDEAEEFAPQTAPDDTGFQLVRQMTWVAKRGRVFGLVPTFITQRPADFAKAVLSQVQTLYFHQLIAPADQAPVKAYLRANADKATLQQVESSLPELGRGERWIYSPRRKLLQRGRTPAIATFDSMATPAPGEARREPPTRTDLDVEKIRTALAPAPAEGERAETQRIIDEAGGALADVLAARDRRIADLETENASIRRELIEVDRMRQLAVETGQRATDALSRTAIFAAEQLDAVAQNGWRSLVESDAARRADKTPATSADVAEEAPWSDTSSAPLSRTAGFSSDASRSQGRRTRAPPHRPPPNPTASIARWAYWPRSRPPG